MFEGCLSWIQRYNLKANHNHTSWLPLRPWGAYHEFKDTIWKPITTWWLLKRNEVLVLIMNSKIQFESQSQPSHVIVFSGDRCLSWIQRYNLKANHNKAAAVAWYVFGAYHEFKDTIWKPITTKVFRNIGKAVVLIMNSKIQFESQSQHGFEDYKELVRCLSWIQRYNLKANHNSKGFASVFVGGAYHEFKDTIWKPITTTTRTWL